MPIRTFQNIAKNRYKTDKNNQITIKVSDTAMLHTDDSFKIGQIQTKTGLTK